MGIGRTYRAARRAEKSSDAPDTMLPRRKRKRKYRRSLLREWLDLMALTLLLALLISPLIHIRSQAGEKWTFSGFVMTAALSVIGFMLMASVAFFIWNYESKRRRR